MKWKTDLWLKMIFLPRRTNDREYYFCNCTITDRNKKRKKEALTFSTRRSIDLIEADDGTTDDSDVDGCGVAIR